MTSRVAKPRATNFSGLVEIMRGQAQALGVKLQKQLPGRDVFIADHILTLGKPRKTRMEGVIAVAAFSGEGDGIYIQIIHAITAHELANHVNEHYKGLLEDSGPIVFGQTVLNQRAMHICGWRPEFRPGY